MSFIGPNRKPNLYGTGFAQQAGLHSKKGSRSDKTAAIAQNIFHASARNLTNYQKVVNNITTYFKFILFPITLVYIGISSVIRSIAVSKGVTGGGQSKKINVKIRQQLQELRGAEEIEFKTADGYKLEGMYFANPKASSKKTVLICSGSHRSHEEYTLPMVKGFMAMGLNVMVFNYRGFGNSEGDASEEGIYLDTEAAYQYLSKRKQLSDDSITVLGYSLGGGPAVDLASHHPIDLIFDRSFTSMSDVAYNVARNDLNLTRIGGMFAKFIFNIGAQFNNLKKIKNIKGRIFLARGKHDKSMTDTMYKKMKREIEKSPGNKDRVFYEKIDVEHIHTDETLWFGKNSHTLKARQHLADFLKPSVPVPQGKRSRDSVVDGA